MTSRFEENVNLIYHPGSSVCIGIWSPPMAAQPGLSQMAASLSLSIVLVIRQWRILQSDRSSFEALLSHQSE